MTEKSQSPVPQMERTRGSVWLDFLTSGLSHTGQETLALRVKFVNAFSMVGLLPLLVFGYIHLQKGHLFVGMFEIGCAELLLGNLLFLRHSARVEIAASVSLLVPSILLTGLLLSGGFEGTGLLWFYCFPVLAFFLKGGMRAVIWIGVLLFCAVGVQVASSSGFVASPYSSVEIQQLIVSVVTMSFMLFFFDSIKGRYEVWLQREVEERRRVEIALRRAHDSLEEAVRRRTMALERVVGRLRKEIADRTKAQRQVQFVSHHDQLTGLCNRSLFHDRLERAIERAGRNSRLVAVIILDLDRFKSINETLGPDVGDAVLCGVADRLKACVPEGGTLARLGGDEFALLVDDLDDMTEVYELHHQIAAVLSQTMILEGHEVFLSASTGIACYPFDGDAVAVLMQNAESAMYRAKEEGGDGLQFYTGEMNSHAFQRFVLEANLRHALERDELVLYFQPKLDLRHNRIMGFEALLRWRHPELGMVSPVQFIPLAEETGLIVPIGEWVLRQSCRQLKAWQNAGLEPGHVAVNLSARQFKQGDLVEMVAGILKETDLLPEMLELEITESLLMENHADNIIKMDQLTEMGVELSIDDFGTGYSSLSYLKRFPLTSLKVDQSFIREITEEEDDRVITEAIVRLAHSLRLNVIAEGVETREQLEFLLQLNCDVMQGFLFSRPVPAGEATALLQNNVGLEGMNVIGPKKSSA